jgi:pimeloyl-ACP methyl ester carboxylesterase
MRKPLLLLLVVTLTACADRGELRPARAHALAPPIERPLAASPKIDAEPVAMAPPAPPPPATVDRLPVAGDRDAFIVKSATGAPPHTVFLPGVCSNAYAYLLGFPEAAQRTGGVVALDGDEPCAPGFRTFSMNSEKAHARIRAALDAAGLVDLPEGDLTIVGYSRGASIAEELTAKYPDKYTRVVIIAPPVDPIASRYAHTHAVVSMACTLDVTWRMKGAAIAIGAQGTPARYMEMKGCTHGNLADGDAVFGDAFGWLDAE